MLHRAVNGSRDIAFEQLGRIALGIDGDEEHVPMIRQEAQTLHDEAEFEQRGETRVEAVRAAVHRTIGDRPPVVIHSARLIRAFLSERSAYRGHGPLGNPAGFVVNL